MAPLLPFDHTTFPLIYWMLRQLPFAAHKHQIEQFRRDAYKGTLIRVLDDFDLKAHHFALCDKNGQILAMARILRSDEIQPFELFRESKAKGLKLPTQGLGLESSRVCAKQGSAGIYLLRLCLGLSKIAQEWKADYLIAKTETHLLPIYRQFGFTAFAPPFISDFFGDNRTVHPIVYRWDHSVAKAVVREEDVLVY
jgi:predicted GNAT family N-acyltransferase